MIKVPSLSRLLPSTPTISQIIEPQLPDFVRDDYPKFVSFLKAYYEWLEHNGADVYSTKIVASDQQSVTLQSDAAPNTNAYENMSIVCLNGPCKGHTRKIRFYDATTKIAKVEHLWTLGFIPPPNTKIVIRDSMYPSKLLDYRDIDKTLDRFVTYFRDEFLSDIPGNILADKRLILKHIKQFYQARGTENSYRFLFRILFNEEVEFYYPKVDLFRASDGRWVVDHLMRVTTTQNTFDWVNREIIGLVSGAKAYVESVHQTQIAGGIISDLYLSNIQGQFVIDQDTGLGEQVKIVYPFVPLPQTDLGALSDLAEPGDVVKAESTYQLLQSLTIVSPGFNYNVGDSIDITGGSALAPAKAIVSAVFTEFFNGRASPPPTTYYLEPYFGPNDVITNDDDPTNDAVCVPGFYYFSDVHSEATSADLLNSSEIILAANESDVDGFFVGDDLALTGGTGNGQQRIVTSYNGLTKIATVDVPFSPPPDGSTTYSIFHNKGGIKAVTITDFGLGFATTPSVAIHSVEGHDAVLVPVLGFVGASAGRWTVGRDGGIGSAPTTPDSFASSNKIIQDSFYWQDFSYDLQFGHTIDQYRDVVKRLLHPAGFKMFGSVLIKSQADTSRFLSILKTYTLELDIKVFQNRIKTSQSIEIDIVNASSVIGTRNKTLDSLKFIGFPPNVGFTLQYPFPNQNYWTPNGPGNTQINNFKDVVIGTIINNPEHRTKINIDSYIKIDNARSFSKVGPVLQNRRILERSKFVGFPPYEGFSLTYPAPNVGYFGDRFGPGNTQIITFQNIVLSDVIVSPETKRSNICADSTIGIQKNSNGVPTIGNVVTYAFLPGIVPQIIYNVSPNSFTNQYDGVLGNDQSVETADPTFVNEGLQLDGSSSQFANASAVPLFLKEGTVIIVAKASDLSSDQSLIQSIQGASDNGFSIDLRQNGGLSFRAQYGGVAKTVTYPDATVTQDVWFMATLTFNEGLLSGKFNTLPALETQFGVFPLAPESNSTGWHFGNPSSDYVTVAHNSALFDGALFGGTQFHQAQTTSSTTTVQFFTGFYAYAMFYDRALYDYEVNATYLALKDKLLNERQISLP
jgi:hypothetical protein